MIADYRKYDLPNGLGIADLNRKTVRSWTEGIRTDTVLRQDAIVLTYRTPGSIGGVPYGMGWGGTSTLGTSTAGCFGNPRVT